LGHVLLKNGFVMQLSEEFTPVAKVSYLLVDAWYTSGKLMLHALKRGYHTIGIIKSNRIIHPRGIISSVKGFSFFISKDETSPVTAGNNTYYTYGHKGKNNDLERVP